MRNITLSFPEDVIERGRDYAKRRGMSLNGLIREALRRMIETDSEEATHTLLEALDDANGNSHGRSWTREELYDRESLS